MIGRFTVSDSRTYMPNEKTIKPVCGFIAIAAMMLVFVLMIPLFLMAINGSGSAILLIISCMYWGVVFPCLIFGLKIINPNEAAVYILFGKYYGTLDKEGFYFINPFCVMINPSESIGKSKKISLKTKTFENVMKNARDSKGNIIEINSEIVWNIENAAKAVFAVDDYISYVESQCIFAVRSTLKRFPYHSKKNKDAKSLSGDLNDIAAEIKSELQKRVDVAGAEVFEVRILSLDRVVKSSENCDKTKKGKIKI